MKHFRHILVLAALTLGTAACDNPVAPRGKGALKGTIYLPIGTYAAIVEIQSEAQVDSVGVGFGDTRTYLPSAQSTGYRFLLASSEPLASPLPIRVFVSDRSAMSRGVVLAAADSAGQVSEADVVFPLK